MSKSSSLIQTRSYWFLPVLSLNLDRIRAVAWQSAAHITAQEIERAVAWEGGTDVSALADVFAEISAAMAELSTSSREMRPSGSICNRRVTVPCQPR